MLFEILLPTIKFPELNDEDETVMILRIELSILGIVAELRTAKLFTTILSVD